MLHKWIVPSNFSLGLYVLQLTIVITMSKYLLTLFCALLTNVCLSQESSDRYRDLSFYCDVMINADDAKHRIYAQEKFNELFTDELKTDSSFYKDYGFLKWIPILENDDKSFRIYSWELKLDNDQYNHFGFIQMADGTIFKLENTLSELEDISYDIISPEDWYGAMYYKLEEFEVNRKKQYVLFGYSSFSKFNKLKIADILSFNEGIPSFGQEVFKIGNDGTRGDVKTRLVLNYSSDANVSLNYNPGLKMIVHDHLIARMGRLPGQGPTQLPDGSYVGWKLKDGMWNYVEKIYDQVSKEAPRPNPILDKRKGSSITGKKNK